MKLYSPALYQLIYRLVIFLVRFAHPILKVRGKENLPDGAAVLCCNHSAFSDPIWVLAAAKFKTPPRIMAKKELLDKPVLGKFLQKMGAFPVERGTNDVKAIYTALRTLREQNKVLVFPEGTRIRSGKTPTPHNGAMLLAIRAKAPVVPIYLSAKKRFWSVIRINFGAPFYPSSGAKPTNEELTQHTAQLMREIYALGESQ